MNQPIKQKTQHHSSVFPATPIILVALGAVVWHAVNLFVQSDPAENVHCDELKVSGIWTLTETPLQYPAAAPSRGDPAEPVPSQVQQVLDGKMLGWATQRPDLVQGDRRPGWS